MSVLLTGFEPFGGNDVNPSWQAVCRVPDSVAGQKVHRLLLPVEYGRAGETLCEAIDRLSPELVICCGVAGGRKAITPELVAINYRMARIPDNAGRLCEGEPIDPTGDAAYMTALPVQQLVARLQESGIPAYVSLSAGAYVCNDLYYALLRRHPRGLFVHVPDSDAADAQTAARALEIIIENA